MAKLLPMTICGTGSYAPQEILTNAHFTEYLDTSDEWIVSRTGIKERRRAAKDESTSTIAVKAAKNALADAGMSIDDIDVIICGTVSGDYPFPATACVIQHELGGKNIPAFDVSAACTGFMYGSIIAAGLIEMGPYKTALVIGAEVLTRFADPQDRATVILFGDGAGAAVWQRTSSPDRGILYAEMGADGSRVDHIWIPGGGSKHPASETTVAERLHFMRMKGRELYKFAVVKMQEIIDRALEESGVKAEELKMVIPHQSNKRMIEAARDRLGLPVDKVFININEYGNTSAASIPMALDAVRRQGHLGEGDLVLLAGIGAGLTWGTMLLRL